VRTCQSTTHFLQTQKFKLLIVKIVSQLHLLSVSSLAADWAIPRHTKASHAGESQLVPACRPTSTYRQLFDVASVFGVLIIF
jgi:hypothetical protein